MAGILSAFSGEFLASQKVSSVLITPLDDEGKIASPTTKGKIPGYGGSKVLQFWPATISTPVNPNWSNKSIPGAPLPLYQWISGGERPISFATVFSRDMDGEIGAEVEEDKYNVDIDAAIAWLNLLAASTYIDDVGGMTVAKAPPLLYLHFLGTELGYNDNKALPAKEAEGSGIDGPVGSGIHCILLSVDAERTNFFPSGRPKMCGIGLNFAQVMQIGNGVYPFGNSRMLELSSKYTRTI